MIAEPGAAAAEFAPLTEEERTILLRLARASIEADLRQAPPPSLETSLPGLSAAGGVFVSLHSGDDLRGCIGTLSSDEPLWRALVRLAVAAARSDPRFEPVQLHDLPSIQIEISRLSPLKAARAEDVIPGKHGICIVRGDRRGVLLPQVATRYGWKREEFLAQTCVKASLPEYSWSLPDTAVFVFEAEVFGDSAATP